MSQKEVQEQIVADLKSWQKIENASMSSCSRILEKTDHPLLRAVMETILRDSQNHYNLQQMILDSLEKKPFTLTPDDVASVWDGIEKHNQLEKKTVEMATKLLGEIKGKHLTAQHYLLRYLLIDEEKHNAMLDMLEKVKNDLYPYN